MIRITVEKMNWQRLALICTLLAFQDAPCLAVDAYSLGSDSYRKGDYKSALSFLVKAVRSYPSYPAVHYQLANTYLQLRRQAEAKLEYSRCLALDPDPTTAAYCRRMITFLSGGQSPPRGSEQGGNYTEAGRTVTPSEDIENESPQAKTAIALERRKQEILMAAEKEARAIREEANRRIQDISETSNQLVVNRDTGDVSTGISSRQAREIQDEANERANKIIWQAEDRANHLKSL